MPSFWMRSTDGQLVKVVPTRYDKEGELQSLIAEYPEILAEALSATEPAAPWLLIRRELSIVFDEGDERTRWSLDHLFVDTEGVPTLVEVKRSSDPRARREVIAQMLDYAASFRHEWTAESLRTLWWQTNGVDEASAQGRMDEFIDGTRFDDEEAFWNEVATKISANRLRLLFVADQFTPHLVRIIEYLNVQMQDTEVVGIEILPHVGTDPSAVAYVPTVRGQTADVPRTKARPSRRTREEFDSMLKQRQGESAVESVARLAAAAEQFGGFVSIGTDARSPRLWINFYTGTTGRDFWPISVASRVGKVYLELRWLANHPAFADEDKRSEFLDRVGKALHISFPDARLDGFPNFPVQVLTQDGAVETLTAVLRWVKETADQSVLSGDER